ncbi:carbonic anhydrase [Cytophagales bacterium LB-30]|uniref:Carbonic anhydrase n=1 Tax=Shiella aurantiaca TaxID=3058365 RepID=A0ABT8F278_9BACT|nr:carbonic anhydrase [Shiella aurantiaca]MDN4164522.1 carbonic anhydrase [Shiella aurantiaca]
MTELLHMEQSYNRLLKGNEKFVRERLALDPDFFAKLAKGQHPEFLWVGCSDSRVPANEITDTLPGEIFVHRNIANMVVHTDLNFLSVLQYAVEVLHVKHIIVCGHYGCGGVLAAMTNNNNGMVNKWLRNIKEVYQKHENELNAISDINLRGRRLVELNVTEQVQNLGKTSIVQREWKRRNIQIHGWVYDIADGIINDLDIKIQSAEDLNPIFRFDENQL